MKKVIVFGTFDIFHEGHRNFLQQAKRHGDFLCVVVARDTTVEKIKKQKPTNNELFRMQEIIKSDLADKVILGSLEDKYESIRKFRPDVICLGYDQWVDENELRNVLKEAGLCDTEIFRLEAYHPEKYKSSKLKNFQQ